MRKKNIIIVLSFILLILISILIYYVLNKDFSVELVKDLEIPIGEKASNLSFIKSVKNGEVISKEEMIDTSSLGIKNISVHIKNKFGRKLVYSYKVNVTDKEAPIITYNKYLEVSEGNEIDLLDGVSVYDNSQEDLEVNTQGEYDFFVPGEYKIFYVSKDSSGNEAREEATLFVKEKPTFNSNGVRKNMSDRTFTTSKGFSAVIKGGILYVDGTLIVNKSYYLPFNFGDEITSETLSAFNDMKNDAKEKGLNIYISSGFRSYSTQEYLYNRYVSKNGKSAADTYSARKGHSEHQTGLAFDVNDITQEFANTKEGIWLSENAYKYGFILRYPKDKYNETGYIYEPWHFRYVGVNLAVKLYNNGEWLTLEDYYGITSSYDY